MIEDWTLGLLRTEPQQTPPSTPVCPFKGIHHCVSVFPKGVHQHKHVKSPSYTTQKK